MLDRKYDTICGKRGFIQKQVFDSTVGSCFDTMLFSRQYFTMII